MAVEFAQIEADFAELRNFILTDIDLIVGMASGGNYAAAAIITCAYETLAAVRGKAKHEVFAESLPDEWRAVAPSLFNALRNGVVHGYRTKAVVVDGRRLEISVSWRQMRHLSFDASRQTLYLNVQQMAADLRRAFEAYEDLLRSNAAARDTYLKRRRGAEVHPPAAQLEAWRRILS
jgi:hypothetical protein